MFLGIFVYAGNERTVGYGLNFKSHLYNPEDRTGLDLSPDGTLAFEGGLTLEFDVCFHRQALAFGYVFRLFSGDASLDMLSNINGDKVNFVYSDGFQTVWNLGVIFLYFSINSNEKALFLQCVCPNIKFFKDFWLKIL